ncbi:hypothetical protein Gorai_024301, partial [Gossypium raimondii]|nr:hypothetical protein [Gossypium raimondii]
MENELTDLSLDDGEEDVLLIPNESGSQSVEVQVHELPMGLFSKIVARQLGDCIENSWNMIQRWSYRHNDSYQIMMSKREELVELGRDLSLRAQFGRVVAMYSVWLIEEGAEGLRVTFGVNGSEIQCSRQIDIEHDAKETPIKGVDGKKRSRKESENLLVFGVEDSILGRKERL